MASNEISGSSGNVFIVSLQETDHSKRIGLEPTQKYKLCVNAFGLVLKAEDKTVVKWELEYIRKYGAIKSDRFTIEAGRRCEMGEGTFSFFCKDAKLIQQSFQLEIQRKFQMEQRRTNIEKAKEEIDCWDITEQLENKTSLINQNKMDISEIQSKFYSNDIFIPTKQNVRKKMTHSSLRIQNKGLKTLANSQDSIYEKIS